MKSTTKNTTTELANLRLVPCDCGSPLASWHGPRDGRREYACDACWNSRRTDKSDPCACGHPVAYFNGPRYACRGCHELAASPTLAADYKKLSRYTAGRIAELRRLRLALAALLEITEDPNLDTGEHAGLDRLETAQKRARAVLRGSL